MCIFIAVCLFYLAHDIYFMLIPLMLLIPLLLMLYAIKLVYIYIMYLFPLLLTFFVYAYFCTSFFIQTI